jgi:hypothetical protein
MSGGLYHSEGGSDSFVQIIGTSNIWTSVQMGGAAHLVDLLMSQDP